ncbi:MAG: radical SAM protein [bacterium]|nr:radical SAM protein [bacterium]
MIKRATHNSSWAKKGFIDDSALKKKGIVVRDLMFYVTQRCNLRCKTCYVGNEWLSSGETYSEEEAKLILRHFGSAGLDRLTFLGGEPVLYPHITDLILLANQFEIKERRMTTNAIELRYLDLTRLKGNELSHISISLDGITSEIHELIRGGGTFNKTVGNIRRLINHGFVVYGNFTVTGLNKHQAIDSVRFFKDLGVKEVNFHLVSMIGNAAKHPELYIQPSEWVEIRKQLESLRGVSGITMRIPLMFVTPEKYEELINGGGYYPFQKRSYHSDTGQRIVLYPNGKVYMSCDLTGTEYNFATFRDGIFTLKDGVNELTLTESNPENADPSSDLLSIDTQGFIRLSISYKETIKL